VPFVTGPSVNIYNPRTLARLAAMGLRRWVMPVELPRDTLAAMQAARPPGVETEVFAYGRVPLALSARCFTARAHDLAKDDCQFRCIDYPDGLLLQTREDAPFLALNGIQTQSARTYTLLGELEDLRGLAVDVIRISPQATGTLAVIDAFADVLAGQCSADEAQQALLPLMPVGGPCDGYWYGRPGLSWGA
jgi:collagenase-like PrtC family protease